MAWSYEHFDRHSCYQSSSSDAMPHSLLPTATLQPTFSDDDASVPTFPTFATSPSYCYSTIRSMLTYTTMFGHSITRLPITSTIDYTTASSQYPTSTYDIDA